MGTWRISSGASRQAVLNSYRQRAIPLALIVLVVVAVYVYDSTRRGRAVELSNVLFIVVFPLVATFAAGAAIKAVLLPSFD
jgi:heme A synthase